MLRLTLLVLAATVLAAGCGGEEGADLVAEETLRDCLAEGGLTVEPQAAGVRAGLGNVSPDFRVTTPEGVAVDVVVQNDSRKTQSATADVRAALQGLGAEGREVLAARNVIVVFEAAPSDEARATVQECLA